MKGNIKVKQKIEGKVSIPEIIEGMSAYGTAVKNGFNGTEAEWLESLKGAQGIQGPKGDKGDKGIDGSSCIAVVTQLPEKASVGSLYFVPMLCASEDIEVIPIPETPEETIAKIYSVNEVGSDEEGDGTTDKPYATIDRVIKAANNEGYGADDVIQIFVKGNVSWGAKNLTAHDFKTKLVVPSGAEGKITSFASTYYPYISLGGQTVFKNIGIEMEWMLGLNGKDTTFKDDCTYKGTNDPSDIALGKYGDNGSSSVVEYSEDMNVIINTAIDKIRLGCRDGKTRHNGIVNIEYNSPYSNPTFYLGSTYGLSDSVVCKQPVNITIKAANSIRVKYLDKVRLSGDNGCIQCFNSIGKNIELDTTEVLNADPEYVLNRIWVFNTQQLPEGVISPTSTKGKLAVNLENPQQQIIAVNNSGAAFVSEDGFLQLPAGFYTLSCVTKPFKGYVSNGEGYINVI